MRVGIRMHCLCTITESKLQRNRSEILFFLLRVVDVYKRVSSFTSCLFKMYQVFHGTHNTSVGTGNLHHSNHSAL
jgi:hypothetical protein